MKKWIHAKEETAEPTIVDLGHITIDIPFPLIEVVASKAYDKDKFISREMLREDLAYILKEKYGFKILKEVDKYRKNSDGSFYTSEGHISSNRDSLSFYFTVRYDMALSDELPHSDNYKFANHLINTECELELRVTDHPFETAIGHLDTMKYDKGLMDQLAKQEGTTPLHRFDEREEVLLPSTIKRHYREGLDKFKKNLNRTIEGWRKTLYPKLQRALKRRPE